MSANLQITRWLNSQHSRTDVSDSKFLMHLTVMFHQHQILVPAIKTHFSKFHPKGIQSCKLYHSVQHPPTYHIFSRHNFQPLWTFKINVSNMIQFRRCTVSKKIDARYTYQRIEANRWSARLSTLIWGGICATNIFGTRPEHLSVGLWVLGRNGSSTISSLTLRNETHNVNSDVSFQSCSLQWH